MSMRPRNIPILLFLSFVVACGDTIPIDNLILPTSTIQVAPSPEATATFVLQPTATPDLRLPPERWREWPVVPSVSPNMSTTYSLGKELGRDPRKFSKVGDCQNVSTYFLGAFDTPGAYRLGTYTSLQQVIDQYAGSWSRESLAVEGGMNVSSQLSPFWADPDMCERLETPLACEIRIHNPSIVIISLETWWGQQPAQSYENAMRQVVEYTLAQGVIPIIATKADNKEGDNSINAAIARIAYDYDIPLWNFWAAVQSLPDQGLTEDGFHLTYAPPYFDDPIRMQNAWPWRNLTALQVMDSLWRNLEAR